MKSILRFFYALCAFVCVFNHIPAAFAAPDESNCQMSIELRDGSRIVGKNLEDNLSFHSGTFCGK